MLAEFQGNGDEMSLAKWSIKNGGKNEMVMVTNRLFRFHLSKVKLGTKIIPTASYVSGRVSSTELRSWS